MTHAESSFDHNSLVINKHASNSGQANKMLYDSKRAYGSGNLKRQEPQALRTNFNSVVSAQKRSTSPLMSLA